MHLTRLDVSTPRAVVLLLHGGVPNSSAALDARSASWLRMAALQRPLARSLRRDDVSTWLLRYRQRGWNRKAPVADARAALEEVRRVVGEVPVVLVGHSMGGRVAVHVADDPSVAGVVALAPWWQRSDPVATLAGRRLTAAHGHGDVITSFAATEAFVRRAQRAGVDAELIDMGMRGHYLLAGAWGWQRTTERAVTDHLSLIWGE